MTREKHYKKISGDRGLAPWLREVVKRLQQAQEEDGGGRELLRQGQKEFPGMNGQPNVPKEPD